MFTAMLEALREIAHPPSLLIYYATELGHSAKVYFSVGIAVALCMPYGG